MWTGTNYGTVIILNPLHFTSLDEFGLSVSIEYAIPLLNHRTTQCDSLVQMDWGGVGGVVGEISWSVPTPQCSFSVPFGIHKEGRMRQSQPGAASWSSFERVLRHQQAPPCRVDGSFDRAEHPALHAVNGDVSLPQRDALAFARGVPRRDAVVRVGLHQRRYVCAVRIPLDEPVELRQAPSALAVASLLGAHKDGGTETRVQACEHRRLRAAGRQALRRRDDALQIQVGIAHRALHARTQCGLEPKSVKPEVGNQRTAVVDPCMGPPHAFLDGLAVVHGKGAGVQRQPAARGQHAVVGLPPRLQALHHRRHKLEQFRDARIHTLAQRLIQRQQMDSQRSFDERVATVIFDCVEITLALCQKARITAHHIAIDHASIDWHRCIEPPQRRLQHFEVVTYQSQYRYTREVEVTLLDDQLAYGVQG